MAVNEWGCELTKSKLRAHWFFLILPFLNVWGGVKEKERNVILLPHRISIISTRQFLILSHFLVSEWVNDSPSVTTVALAAADDVNQVQEKVHELISHTYEQPNANA